MDEVNPRIELMRLVGEAGTQGRVGRRLGISRYMMSKLLRGHRKFSEEMLHKMGLRRIVVRGGHR